MKLQPEFRMPKELYSIRTRSCRKWRQSTTDASFDRDGVVATLSVKSADERGSTRCDALHLAYPVVQERPEL